MKPPELDTWLTEEGDRLVRKIATTHGVDALDARERLVYEIWLFDTEQRNGGVSQYFCNRGLEQWRTLSEIASTALTSFVPLAEVVNQVIDNSTDPYRALIKSAVNLDAYYQMHRVRLLAELRSLLLYSNGKAIE